MDFQSIIAKLESQGRVARIKTEVDPIHELAGVAAKLEGGKVAFFEKVKGSDFPVVCGLWWNRENVAAVFDTTAEEVPYLFAGAAREFAKSPIEPITVDNAPSQEVVSLEPNLYEIPVPTLALKDGGPYFSNCVVMAKDPDTGVRNSSVHRLQVVGKNRLTMLMDMGRDLRDYYERAEKNGIPLEITINNGIDPAVFIAAITAGVPMDIDELGIAAVLRGKPVRLSKSLTVGVEGIADAQLVIEGEILPNVREPEGPFGEVSGYYAQKDDRWVVNVKAITRRKQPLIHALLPGKEVWVTAGLAAEPAIFNTLSKQIGGVKKVYLSPGCCAHFGAIIQVDPVRPGFGKNAILATFGAFPPLKMVVAVNSDVNIYDSDDVMRAITTRCEADKDIIVIPRSACHELNPCMDDGYGAKIGFDCTVPIPASPKFERFSCKEVDLKDYQIE